MAYGFVYVLQNMAMPGLYKIGRTERHPEHRIAELNSRTALPDDFFLLCYIDVEDDVGAEYHFHQVFADQRYSKTREFFRLDIAHLAFEISAFCRDGSGYLVDKGGLTPSLYAAHKVAYDDIRYEWEVGGMRDRILAAAPQKFVIRSV